MTTPPKPDHEKRPFRFKLEGPFLRVSTMLLITPISPNFKGLKCSVFGRFRALQSRKNYGTIKEVVNRGGRYVESCFGINFQLKSSCDVTFENGHVVYDLESKNYNDLVEESSMLPNILILLALPTDSNDWLEVTADQLIMKRCAWWCSLEGQEPTTNQTTKRIFIPDGQILSPAALIGLMEKVKGGKKL